MLLKLVEFTIIIDSFTPFKAKDNTYTCGHAKVTPPLETLASLLNLKHCVPVHLQMMKTNQSEIRLVNSL